MASSPRVKCAAACVVSCVALRSEYSFMFALIISEKLSASPGSPLVAWKRVSDRTRERGARATRHELVAVQLHDLVDGGALDDDGLHARGVGHENRKAVPQEAKQDVHGAETRVEDVAT